MKRPLCCLVAFFALVAAHAALAQTTAPSIPDPAEWVPADALIYVGVTDVAETWNDYKKTIAYKMATDPGLNPQGAATAGLVEKFQARLAKFLNVSADQLTNPFAGPLAFYVTLPPGGKMEDLQAALVAGVGDAAMMRTYYDGLLARLKAAATHEAETAGTFTIDVFTPANGKKRDVKGRDNEFDDLDQKKAVGLGAMSNPTAMVEKELDAVFSLKSLPAKLALCLTPERFVIAGSPEDVKALLGIDRPRRPLAESDDYQALLKELRPLGTVRFLINLPRLIQAAAAASGESDAETAQKMIKVLGGDGVRSLVGHLRAGASAYDAKLEMLLLTAPERTGLAKLLAMDNRPVAPPPTVTSDTLGFASVNLNPPQLLESILEMARQADPATAEAMTAQLEKYPIGPDTTLDVRKEVIENLAGPLMVTVGMAKPLAPTSGRFLIALGHRDQTALAKVLNGFVGLFQPREVKGTPLFDPALAPGTTIAVTGDRLLAGNTPAVEGALETPTGGTPLAETEVWRRAARVVPNEAWLTIYLDDRATMSAAQELAVNPPQPSPLDPGSFLIAAEYQRLATAGATEDKAKARKLLKMSSQSIFTIATTPAGIRFTFVTLRPEE